MAYFKLFKVNSLPGIPERNAIYFVQNGHVAEAYLTSAGGLVKSLGNTEMIQNVAENMVHNLNLISVVDDIPKRNLLNPRRNILTLVKDATGDSTVRSGAALYFYSLPDLNWIKILEYDSLDITIQWDNVLGKPNSTTEQIDNAVAQSHYHLNTLVLNELTENNGKLIFKGREDGTLPSNVIFDGGHF